ncbi:MAG: methyltransferase domain-containing protein, partial [Armatimonadetes bacterium]|nr:methyltransferase domain-containing protein [Armatimonadota bacterium]
MDAGFAEQNADNERRWDANAAWWDARIGDGNDFQDLLIEPATLDLLDLAPGMAVLDIACGGGRLARRMAALGARVTAFDQSPSFIELARQRTPGELPIDYRVCNATDAVDLAALGQRGFDRAVCTMALMDMPDIAPLLAALPSLLSARGSFVFSVTHPCFHSAPSERFCELTEGSDGRYTPRAGVRVLGYRAPTARLTEGIVGQPEAQWVFHRSLTDLL